MPRVLVVGGNREPRRDLSPAYRAFMASPRWQEIRAEALEEAGYRCKRCGATERLEVHHQDYSMPLGEEYIEFLDVLCPACHDQADVERREIQYRRRVTAWARKVYGWDWKQHADYDDVVDEFESWLRRKADA